MSKALALMSGGLDSSLAAWLVKKQGIKIKALIFKSVFFGPEKGIRAAKQLGFPYQVIDISQKLLEIIKNPPHGFGTAANPCIDCHLIMLKKANQVMDKQNYDFVVTGEVIGQRPFSQNKQAMQLLAEKSGLKQRLVRPLSAKKLEPTLPEEKGWLNRNELLEISGRGRKKQMALAKKLGFDYPQPAGGCILTETEFAKKIFDLKNKKQNFDLNDVQLLKIGRHFWQANQLVVIGKNEEENNRLEKIAYPNDRVIYPANFIGPTGLIRGKNINQKLITNTQQLILKYTPIRKQQVFKNPLVFFGSSPESVLVLKQLLVAKIPVGAIITKPDKPAGRGQKISPTPVAKFAKKQNLATFKFKKLTYKTRQRVEQKLKYKPHWGVVAVYGNIIPKFWLDWSNIVLNIHPSLLPKWRGAAPTIRAVEAGDKSTGWTIFKLIKKMDAGPIINQQKVKIRPQETAGQITTRLFKLATDRLVEILANLYRARSPKFWVMQPQDDSQATYAEKVEKKEAKIVWSQPPKKIVNKIQAFNTWPGAYTMVEINGEKKRLKIWQAHVEDNKVVPDIVHLEGKRRCPWSQFSRDYKITLKDLKKPN